MYIIFIASSPFNIAIITEIINKNKLYDYNYSEQKYYNVFWDI